MARLTHSKRDNNSLCPTASYVSPNSLVFSTKCGQTLADSAEDSLFYTDEDSASFEDCMGECGISRPECFAVAYLAGSSHCLLFNSTSTSEQIIGDNGDDKIYDVGIANAQQLEQPVQTGCPFASGAVYTTQSGMQFDILCDRDLGSAGGDFCADNYSHEDWKCTPHANSMQECMEICSNAHPLCKGISFNPSMDYGFGNCYLKNDPEAATDPSVTNDVQSARVTSSLYNIDASCSDEASYKTSESNDVYSVSCWESRTGSQNITATHARSLDECLNDCSDANSCKGVVFDMGLTYGYKNCYHLNSTGVALPGTNTTFALRQSSDNHPGKESEAWVAGPVLGVFILLIFGVGLGLYWRKRSARKKAYKSAPVKHFEVYEKQGKDRMYEIGPGAHGVYDRRYELRDPNSEALFQHEMAQSAR